MNETYEKVDTTQSVDKERVQKMLDKSASKRKGKVMVRLNKTTLVSVSPEMAKPERLQELREMYGVSK